MRTLLELDRDGSAPSAEQQQILARWSGWGAVPAVFDADDNRYAAERAELQKLLSEPEYAAARRATLNSHYTDASLIPPIWDAVQALGITGGQVLEPGCGSGNFIGLAPETMRMTGVEWDPTTAAVASALYPDATVIGGSFADLVPARSLDDDPDAGDGLTNPDEGKFDAVVGNVPFARLRLYDPDYNAELYSIHNHFILKSLRLTRPGGVVALLTSRYTLDAQDQTVRDEIGALADLLSAVRLPTGAHHKAAGTHVITDLLVLRRRDVGDPTVSGAQGWRRLREISVRDNEDRRVPLDVNEYFRTHPDHVLGEAGATHGQFTDHDLVIRPHPGVDLATQLHAIVSADVVAAQASGLSAIPAEPEREPVALRLRSSLDKNREGALTLDEPAPMPGKSAAPVAFRRWIRGHWRPHELPKGQIHELAALLRIRDTALELLAAEEATCPPPNVQAPARTHTEPGADEADSGHYTETDVTTLRSRLNERYDAYVAEYGPVRRFTWTTSNQVPWTVFSRWCKEQEPTPSHMPAERSTVLGYLRHLSEGGCGAQRMTTHLDAITKRHTKKQLPLAEDVVRDARGFIADHPADDYEHIDYDALGLRLQKKDTPSQGGFRSDPHAPRVYALEQDYDPVTNIATKDTVFTQRVVWPITPRDRADSPADAVSLCLNKHGRLRLDAIATLLDLPNEAEALTALGDLVFTDPDTEHVVLRNDYLSGNVRRKLASAETAAERDPRWQVNLDALRAVVPATLGPEEIEIQLGGWIDATYVQQFIRELLHDDTVQVDHPGPDVWVVQGGLGTRDAREEWGTQHRSPQQLLEANLTGRPIRITYTGADRLTYTDVPATEAAKRKAALIAARFTTWVWEDTTRARDLVQTYNNLFNAEIPRSYDDIDIDPPGLSPTYTLFAHQRTAVAAQIFNPAFGLFHEVGAGKTLEMIIGGMECHRLGLTRRQVVVVPNHMLDEFTSQWLRAYPRADLLAASSDELSGNNRRIFIARILTGDHDAIILTRGAFRALPVSYDTEHAYHAAALDEVTIALDAAKTHGCHERTVKELEEAKAQATESLKRRLEDIPRDRGVCWEDLGIDKLIVDEAQDFKNDRRFSVLPDTAHPGSLRAIDLDMKLGQIVQKYGAHRVILATATPWTNALAEIHTVLRRLGAPVGHLDTWQRTYGVVRTTQEMVPGGGFKAKSRLRTLINVPELYRQIRLYADIRTADDLNLPTPTVRTSIIEVPASPELQLYNQLLGERYDKIPRRPQKGDDNHLSLLTEGVAAAVDLRLVGWETDEPQKVTVLADRILDRWRAHSETRYLRRDQSEHPTPGGLQLVFCSMSVPKPGWNFYDELRAQLVAGGMPRTMVRYIHEANTEQKIAELFAAARSGEIAVLIGSAEKMGTGVNVQDRALGLYRVDPPWRPDIPHQQRGRVERQGNQNSEVFDETLITTPSLEAKRWEIVRQKWDAYRPLMTGKFTGRVIDMPDKDMDLFTELMAAGTGDLRYKELSELEPRTKSLREQRSYWARRQSAHRLAIDKADTDIPELRRDIAAIDAAIARRIDTSGDRFAFTTETATYASRPETARHISTAIARHLTRLDPEQQESLILGTLGGHTLRAELTGGDFHIPVHFDGIPGFGSLHAGSLPVPYNWVQVQEHRLNNLEATRGMLGELMTELRDEADQARLRIGQPFDQQAELDDAEQRLERLQNELVGNDQHTVAEPEEGEHADAAPAWEEAGISDAAEDTQAAPATPAERIVDTDSAAPAPTDVRQAWHPAEPDTAPTTTSPESTHDTDTTQGNDVDANADLHTTPETVIARPEPTAGHDTAPSAPSTNTERENSSSGPTHHRGNTDDAPSRTPADYATPSRPRSSNHNGHTTAPLSEQRAAAGANNDHHTTATFTGRTAESDAVTDSGTEETAREDTAMDSPPRSAEKSTGGPFAISDDDRQLSEHDNERILRLHYSFDHGVQLLDTRKTDPIGDQLRPLRAGWTWRQVLNVDGERGAWLLPKTWKVNHDGDPMKMRRFHDRIHFRLTQTALTLRENGFSVVFDLPDLPEREQQRFDRWCSANPLTNAEANQRHARTDEVAVASHNTAFLNGLWNHLDDPDVLDLTWLTFVREHQTDLDASAARADTLTPLATSTADYIVGTDSTTDRAQRRTLEIIAHLLRAGQLSGHEDSTIFDLISLAEPEQAPALVGYLAAAGRTLRERIDAQGGTFARVFINTGATALSTSLIEASHALAADTDIDLPDDHPRRTQPPAVGATPHAPVSSWALGPDLGLRRLPEQIHTLLDRSWTEARSALLDIGAHPFKATTMATMWQCAQGILAAEHARTILADVREKTPELIYAVLPEHSQSQDGFSVRLSDGNDPIRLDRIDIGIDGRLQLRGHIPAATDFDAVVVFVDPGTRRDPATGTLTPAPDTAIDIADCDLLSTSTAALHTPEHPEPGRHHLAQDVPPSETASADHPIIDVATGSVPEPALGPDTESTMETKATATTDAAVMIQSATPTGPDHIEPELEPDDVESETGSEPSEAATADSAPELGLSPVSEITTSLVGLNVRTPADLFVESVTPVEHGGFLLRGQTGHGATRTAQLDTDHWFDHQSRQFLPGDEARQLLHQWSDLVARASTHGYRIEHERSRRNAGYRPDDGLVALHSQQTPAQRVRTLTDLLASLAPTTEPSPAPAPGTAADHHRGRRAVHEDSLTLDLFSTPDTTAAAQTHPDQSRTSEQALHADTTGEGPGTAPDIAPTDTSTDASGTDQRTPTEQVPAESREHASIADPAPPHAAADTDEDQPWLADHDFPVVEGIDQEHPIDLRRWGWTCATEEPNEIGVSQGWYRNDLTLGLNYDIEDRLLSEIHVRDESLGADAQWIEIHPELTQTRATVEQLLADLGRYGVATPTRDPRRWAIRPLLDPRAAWAAPETPGGTEQSDTPVGTDDTEALFGPGVRWVERDDDLWQFTDTHEPVDRAPYISVPRFTSRASLVNYLLDSSARDVETARRRALVGVMLSGRARGGVRPAQARTLLADADPAAYRRVATAMVGCAATVDEFDLDRARAALHRLANDDPSLPLNSVGQSVALPTDLHQRGVVTAVTPGEGNELVITLEHLETEDTPSTLTTHTVPIDATLFVLAPAESASDQLDDVSSATQTPSADLVAGAEAAGNRTAATEAREPTYTSAMHLGGLFEIAPPDHQVATDQPQGESPLITDVVDGSTEDTESVDGAEDSGPGPGFRTASAFASPGTERLSGDDQAEPLTDEDIAHGVRHMGPSNVRAFLRSAATGSPANPTHFSTWLGWRDPHEADAGARDEGALIRQGLELAVRTETHTRRGRISWAMLARWLAPGVGGPAGTVLGHATTAQISFAHNRRGFSAIGESDWAAAADIELDEIADEAVSEIVEQALTAHRSGTAPGPRARNAATLRPIRSADDQHLDGVHGERIARIDALTGVLPEQRRRRRSLDDLHVGDVFAHPGYGFAPFRVDHLPVPDVDGLRVDGRVLGSRRDDTTGIDASFTIVRDGQPRGNVELIAFPTSLVGLIEPLREPEEPEDTDDAEPEQTAAEPHAGDGATAEDAAEESGLEPDPHATPRAGSAFVTPDTERLTSGDDPAEPLTDEDIAHGVRHIATYDLRRFLRKAAAGKPENPTLGFGWRVTRKATDPDAGAADDGDLTRYGLELAVATPTHTRRGRVSWRMLARWIAPGIGGPASTVLDHAETALSGFAHNRDGFSATGESDWALAAEIDIRAIAEHAVNEIVEHALHAHRDGTAPGPRARNGATFPPILSAAEQHLDGVHGDRIARIDTLTSVLPATQPTQWRRPTELRVGDVFEHPEHGFALFRVDHPVTVDGNNLTVHGRVLGNRPDDTTGIAATITFDRAEQSVNDIELITMPTSLVGLVEPLRAHPRDTTPTEPARSADAEQGTPEQNRADTPEPDVDTPIDTGAGPTTADEGEESRDEDPPDHLIHLDAALRQPAPPAPTRDSATTTPPIHTGTPEGEPAPPTDDDIAHALRHLQPREALDFALAAARGRTWYPRSERGWHGPRGVHETDPGARTDITITQRGLELRLDTDSHVRSGTVSWRTLSRWLRHGVDHPAATVLSRVDNALDRFALYQQEFAAIGEPDLAATAVRELELIAEHTTLHAIDGALAARPSDTTSASAETPPLWLSNSASAARPSGLLGERLDRIEALTSVLPADDEVNLVPAAQLQAGDIVAHHERGQAPFRLDQPPAEQGDRIVLRGTLLAPSGADDEPEHTEWHLPYNATGDDTAIVLAKIDLPTSLTTVLGEPPRATATPATTTPTRPAAPSEPAPTAATEERPPIPSAGEPTAHRGNHTSATDTPNDTAAGAEQIPDPRLAANPDTPVIRGDAQPFARQDVSADADTTDHLTPHHSADHGAVPGSAQRPPEQALPRTDSDSPSSGSADRGSEMAAMHEWSDLITAASEHGYRVVTTWDGASRIDHDAQVIRIAPNAAPGPRAADLREHLNQLRDHLTGGEHRPTTTPAATSTPPVEPETERSTTRETPPPTSRTTESDTRSSAHTALNQEVGDAPSADHPSGLETASSRRHRHTSQRSTEVSGQRPAFPAALLDAEPHPSSAEPTVPFPSALLAAEVPTPAASNIPAPAEVAPHSPDPEGNTPIYDALIASHHQPSPTSDQTLRSHERSGSLATVTRLPVRDDTTPGHHRPGHGDHTSRRWWPQRHSR